MKQKKLHELITTSLLPKLGACQVLLDSASCHAYGYDNGRHQHPADAVVIAEDEISIQQTLKFCHEHQVALTTRGRGTGTPGGAVPIHGGIVLSLERMNKIIEIDANNRCLIAQAGTTNQAVQLAAHEYGFFWAPDPSSSAYCSIGGNLAYNSAGPRCLKYGSCRENTLSLRAITAQGDIITTGFNTTKSACGYDLTRLLIGSEGTLAIITQATLKLLPLPNDEISIRVCFASIQAAADSVCAILASKVTPAALEFLDDSATALIRDKVSLPNNCQAILLIRLEGGIDTIKQEQIILAKLLEEYALQIDHAHTAAEAKHLWQTRKALSQAQKQVAPNKINEDIVVPVDKLPSILTAIREIAAQQQTIMLCFGHIGNGNLHVNMLYDASDADANQRAHKCLHLLFDLVIKHGGTLSGEHGIGIEKRDYLPLAIGELELTLMRNIKQVFDPKGILNPGKLF